MKTLSKKLYNFGLNRNYGKTIDLTNIHLLKLFGESLEYHVIVDFLLYKLSLEELHEKYYFILNLEGLLEECLLKVYDFVEEFDCEK